MNCPVCGHVCKTLFALARHLWDAGHVEEMSCACGKRFFVRGSKSVSNNGTGKVTLALTRNKNEQVVAFAHHLERCDDIAIHLARSAMIAANRRDLPYIRSGRPLPSSELGALVAAGPRITPPSGLVFNINQGRSRV